MCEKRNVHDDKYIALYVAREKKTRKLHAN